MCESITTTRTGIDAYLNARNMFENRGLRLFHRSDLRFETDVEKGHRLIGAQEVIPPPDFRVSPGGRKTQKHTGKQRLAWQQELGGGEKFGAAGLRL